MAVKPPLWTFVLTDLQGVVQGEINNADARQVVLPLNRLPTATFRIPLAHPLANTVLSQDCMVKAYRWDNVITRKLMFFGPVLSAEEQAERDVQSVQVNAVGPFWRLTKRLIGTDKNGISFGQTGALLEITEIAANVVSTVNGVSGGYTGITVTTRTSNTPPNMTKVGPYHLKNAAELIAELSASVNAFDYEVVPVEPTASGFTWPIIGNMRIVPYIGVTRPDAIFEYGGGAANIVGYQRAITRENYLNKGYVTAPGWPDGTDKELRVRENTASQTSRGLFEDSISDGGVGEDSVRDAIGDEHIYHRAAPRSLISVTVAPNAKPWIWESWEVGDTIRCRAAVRGTVRFDAMFRVWGATFDIDKNGNETVTLELAMP